MVHLRILIIAFSLSLTLPFNIERAGIFRVNHSSIVYILFSGIVMLLLGLSSLRLEILLIGADVFCRLMRSLAVGAASSLTVVIIVELVILSAIIVMGRLISSVVINFEHVFHARAAQSFSLWSLCGAMVCPQCVWTDRRAAFPGAIYFSNVFVAGTPVLPSHLRCSSHLSCALIGFLFRGSRLVRLKPFGISYFFCMV